MLIQNKFRVLIILSISVTITRWTSVNGSPVPVWPSNNCNNKPCACSAPPSWSFYDIVDHLTSINITAIDSQSTVSSKPVAMSNSNRTLITPHLSDPSIQFHYSANTSQLENVFVTKHDTAFERHLLGDLRNNVTLVVGINLNEHRLHSDQQIFNLQQIYKSLQEVSLKNIRFILVNSRMSINPSWVYELRGRVSFEVYQEMPSSPLIGTLLPGDTGDIFIFDRCGLLTYYIPFPLSFIHTQQPILQAALLATYFDSPCSSKCNSTLSKPASSTLVQSTNYNVQVNMNKSTLKLNGTSLQEQDMTYSEMAQVLMKFFGQILPDTIMNRESLNNQTSPGLSPSSSNGTQQQQNSTPSTKPVLSMKSTNSVLNKLRDGQTEQTNDCNRSTCSEWSTEGLLKARLCCLNAPLVDDDDGNTSGGPSSSSSLSNNTTEETIDQNDSRFGCELYAKARCRRIMPMIRCCLRNVLNKYFDFTLKMREQQQQQKQSTLQSPIRADSSLLSSQKSITESGYRMEYPADYILHHSIGSQLIPDYFKQQHRKRVFQTAPPQKT